MKHTLLAKHSAPLFLFLTATLLLILSPLTGSAQNSSTGERLEGTTWRGTMNFTSVPVRIIYVFIGDGQVKETFQYIVPTAPDYVWSPSTRRMEPVPLTGMGELQTRDTVCKYKRDGDSIQFRCYDQVWTATIQGNHMEGNVIFNKGTPQERTVKWSAERIVSPYGEIENDSVWIDFDAHDDQTKGMRIHISFTVGNVKDKECIAVAYFYYASGEPLKALHDKFKAADGNVAVGDNFIPTHATSSYKDFQLFMPYDELALPAGNYDLKFNVKLHCGESGFLAHSEVHGFTLKKK